ncbi:hypothetical protein ACFFUE_10235 [Bergeyella porcorum]|uniref:hypothetical protein n=1 Tax=Bergeyella porcorum TaxID=1735111 RepID=UPI0035ECF261
MNIEQLKKKIPHGGMKAIAKRSKIHYITIISFFNGKKTLSERLETKILTATAEYLEDLKKQKNNALERLNAIN